MHMYIFTYSEILIIKYSWNLRCIFIWLSQGAVNDCSQRYLYPHTRWTFRTSKEYLKSPLQIPAQNSSSSWNLVEGLGSVWGKTHGDKSFVLASLLGKEIGTDGWDLQVIQRGSWYKYAQWTFTQGYIWPLLFPQYNNHRSVFTVINMMAVRSATSKIETHWLGSWPSCIWNFDIQDGKSEFKSPYRAAPTPTSIKGSLNFDLPWTIQSRYTRQAYAVTFSTAHISCPRRVFSCTTHLKRPNWPGNTRELWEHWKHNCFMITLQESDSNISGSVELQYK